MAVKATPATERFAAKVDRLSPSECWPWQAAVGSHGYGVFHPSKGETTLAHRYAWEALYGPVPDGMHLDHLCHNADSTCPGGRACTHRQCVNPGHLEPVEPDRNRARSPRANERKTHCPRGHFYSAENTYIGGKGERRCRECARIRDRARPPRNRTKIGA